MKAFILKTARSLFFNEVDLKSYKYLSAKSIRFLLWTRIILKVYLFLLGLYLVANFASLIKRLMIH
jgi:hypothetical protein